MDKQKLYEGLRELRLLYDPAAASDYGSVLEFYGGFLRETSWFRALPKELRRRYGLCVALNGAKFSLAAESFHKPRDREAISAAVCFILVGCLLDHLLDEGSPDEQKLAREKLEWDYCAHYFVRFGPMMNHHAVDGLYSVVAAFLQKRRVSCPGAYDQLLGHLKRAVLAETADGSSIAADRTLVRDKSVLFVVIGFELALYGEHSRQEWDTFFLIGDIFRMIDDLCDAEQDAEAGRTNSLLSRHGLTTRQLLLTLSELRRALERLDELACEPFCAFIRHEIRTWTLSNPYLFNRTMEASPCPIL